MCGKCEVFMAKLGCGSIAAGLILIILAAVSRLAHLAILGLGPRSFAAGAALLLLLSIAIHTCQSTCHSEEPAPQG